MNVTMAPLSITRTRGRVQINLDQVQNPPRHDVRILEALGRALYWEQLLDTGRFKSISALAAAEGLQPTTVARLLRLARLSPAVVQELMAGQQPMGLSLYWLQRHDIPNLWTEQRATLEKLR